MSQGASPTWGMRAGVHLFQHPLRRRWSALAALVVPAADETTVLGRPLGDGLRRGLPLARAQVLEPSQRIPDGLRVVALPVTPETAAGGQIVPGNDVEILATLDKTNPDRAR